MNGCGGAITNPNTDLQAKAQDAQAEVAATQDAATAIAQTVSDIARALDRPKPQPKPQPTAPNGNDGDGAPPPDPDDEWWQ
jgi:hypothetical protein